MGEGDSEEGEAREALRGAEGQEGPLDEQGPDRRADRAYEWREEGLLHEGPQGARGVCAQAPGEGDRDSPKHRPLEDAHEKATKAGKRMMFGVEMKVKAKPARKVVKAFPVKALKD